MEVVVAKSGETPPPCTGATLHGAGFEVEFDGLPEPSWLAALVVETARQSRC
jgi:hypothetical protein